MLTFPIPAPSSISRDKHETLARWQRPSTTVLLSFKPCRLSSENLKGRKQRTNFNVSKLEA